MDISDFLKEKETLKELAPVIDTLRKVWLDMHASK